MIFALIGSVAFMLIGLLAWWKGWQTLSAAERRLEEAAREFEEAEVEHRAAEWCWIRAREAK